MAACIRCGKPCRDGENMCDECKAWFQQKTGGKASAPKRVTTPTAKPAAKPAEKASQPAAGSTQAGASGTVITGGGKPNKGNGIDPKMIIIIAAIAIIAVIAVVVIAGLGKKNKDKPATGTAKTEQDAGKDQNPGDDPSAAQEDNADDLQEDTDPAQGEENPDAQGAEEQTAEVDNSAEVVPLQDKYNALMVDYRSGEGLEILEPEEDVKVYYVYDELKEIDGRMDSVPVEFYYDQGSLYYAYMASGEGGSTQIYVKDDTVLRRIDGNGNKQDLDTRDGYEDLYRMVDQAQEWYAAYENKDAFMTPNDEAEYIFPNSDKELLTEADFEGLTEWEVRVGRNELMARHGRRFKDEKLQEHFDSCSWYEGTIEGSEFDKKYESMLSSIEKQNAEIIKTYEKKHNMNQ